MEAITYSKVYRGFPILTNREKGLGCLTHILDAYIEQLLYMVHNHSKVMQIRFDLHYPDEDSFIPKRKYLHDFCYNLRRRLKRKKFVGGHKLDPHFIHTSEKHYSRHEHFHFVLLLNANASQAYLPILINNVVPSWQTVLKTEIDGLVDFCNRKGFNGIVMDRNSPYFKSRVHLCSLQASYIAKIHTKEFRGKGNWLCGSTRITSDYNSGNGISELASENLNTITPCGETQ